MPNQGDDNGDVDIDLTVPPGSFSQVDEGDRLKFARQVLCVLCIIIVTVFFSHAIWKDNEAITQIFEFVKIGALPLITLIITFYFPNNSQK